MKEIQRIKTRDIIHALKQKRKNDEIQKRFLREVNGTFVE